MDFISNFIVQSPFLFLGLILTLALIFFFVSMYFLLQKVKKEDWIQNAIKQKKMDELKAHEDYKAQFKAIHHVREKFKGLRRQMKH